MSPNPDTRSVADLIGDAFSQLSALMRNEIELAKAEISAKVAAIGGGIAMVAVGGVFAMAGLVLLLMALAEELVVLGLAPPLADLISAVVGFVIAVALAMAGMSRLKPENLAPRRTARQLRRDAAVAREHVS